MFCPGPFSQILKAFLLTAAMVAVLGISARAQEAPAVHVDSATVTGLPDDWSFHRVVFSDPGAEQEASAKGSHDWWLRVVNDPRYVLQQLRRRGPVQGPAFQDVETWEKIRAQGVLTGPVRIINPVLKNWPLKKDWSMALGEGGASLTLTAAAATSGNVTAGTSILTVNGSSTATITASAPSDASETGTFTGNPANAQTLKITNGTNSQTLTASTGTAGTLTGTFSSVPTEATVNAGDSITIADGANTLSVTTTATGATLTGSTWTNDPTTTETAPTFAISNGTTVTTTLAIASGAATPSATAAFSGVPTAGQTVVIPSGIQTMTLTAAAPTGSTAGTIQVNTPTPGATDTLTLTTAAFGTVTYTFSTTPCGTTANCIYAPAIGNNRTNMAANIQAAINANASQCGDPAGGPCFGSNTVVNPYVVAGASTNCAGNRCIALTNESYQLVTLGKTGTSGDFTLTSPTAPTNNGCTANTATATTGTFIIGTGALGSAENLYGAINACNSSYSVIGTSASSFTAATDSFTISETVYGALESSFTENLSNFTLTSVQAGNLGSANSCTKVSGTAYTANYEAANTAAGLAANVVAALQACPAAGGNIYALATTGAGFTVYDNTLDSATSAFGTTGAGTPSLVTWGSTKTAGTAGSNACTSTTAATIQVTSTDTTTTNATNLAAALNLCATANDSTIGIATGASAPHVTSSGATVTIVANVWVANPGLTLGATASGPFSWAASSITNGVNGNSTAPNFAVDNVLAHDAANLAADINNYTSTVGVIATNPSGADVTIAASAPGASGNSITLTDGLSGITLGSPLAGGSDGTSNGTNFSYWTGNAYDTAAQLATSLAASINAAGAGVTANANGAYVTITATALGTAGAGYSASETSFPAVTGNIGAFTGGSYQGAGQYPAKYNFYTSTESCSDWVVFPTGVTGSSTHATLIAYNNIYVGAGACQTSTPTVNWAYNTGGTANISPILSLDGTQVAYIQSSGGVASLVLLKWAATPATITTAKGSVSSSSVSITATSGITAADVGMQITDTTNTSCIPSGDTIAAFSGATVTLATATIAGCGTHAGDSLTLTSESVATPGVPPLAASGAAYRSCTAPCYYPIVLNGSPSDSLSAPFYRYDGSDTLYVGDDNGYLHEITGVFSGSPAETVASGWPIAVNASAYNLTGPVYDPGTGYVFVADSGGYLYSYNVAPSTPVHEMTSSKMTFATGTTGIVDAPLVDSTAKTVYVSAGTDANTSTSNTFNCEVATGCSGIFQFATTNTTVGTGACNATSGTSWPAGTNCGQEAVFGVSSYPNMYDGDFDNTYYTAGTGKTGRLWVCVPSNPGGTVPGPRLSYIPIQSNGGIVPSGNAISYLDADKAISSLTSGSTPAPTCSPVTEVYGSDGTTNDYIFLSVSALGNLTTTNASARCTGACLYNFIVGTGGTEVTPTTAYAGISSTGGTGAIIIDNTSSATGASQIYYGLLGNQACTGGTGGCAVQTQQTVP